jgi:hypothetical protein
MNKFSATFHLCNLTPMDFFLWVLWRTMSSSPRCRQHYTRSRHGTEGPVLIRKFSTTCGWRLNIGLMLLGVGLLPLDCWGHGFESRTEHGCLSVVLSCVGRGLCDGLITRTEESYLVSVRVYDQETPKMEAKGPSWTISTCEWMNWKQFWLIKHQIRKTIYGHPVYHWTLHSLRNRQATWNTPQLINITHCLHALLNMW